LKSYCYLSWTWRDSKHILSWDYDRECFEIYHEVAITIATRY